MGMLDRAEAFLRAKRQSVLGRSVRYVRGSDSTLLVATQAQSDLEIDPGEAAYIAAESVDWIIDVADLMLAGAAVKPKPGDRIERLDDASQVVATYEVMNLADECYRWHGRDRMSYRVHSKEVGS